MSINWGEAAPEMSQNHIGGKRPLRHLVQPSTYHKYCPLNHVPRYSTYMFLVLGGQHDVTAEVTCCRIVLRYPTEKQIYLHLLKTSSDLTFITVASTKPPHRAMHVGHRAPSSLHLLPIHSAHCVAQPTVILPSDGSAAPSSELSSAPSSPRPEVAESSRADAESGVLGPLTEPKSPSSLLEP